MVFPNKFVPPCSMTNLEVDNLFSVYTEITNLEVNNNVEVGNRILVNNGSLSNPSISWLFSADTGFYRPISKSIGVVCGGAEKMRLDNTSTNLLMPVNISNNLLSPTDYIRFSNSLGDTQIKCIGNTASYISFENPINDTDLQVGIDNSQNAFLKSKTNLKIQDENAVDSVELTINKNGIKLYNNIPNYIPSNLDYYEDVVISSVNVFGGSVPIILSNIRFIRCGKMVTMFLPEISVSGNNNPLTISNMVPTRFLPNVNSNFYVVSFDTLAVLNPPNQGNGHCDINSISGDATFYRTPNHLPFTTGAICGIRACYLNWMTS